MVRWFVDRSPQKASPSVSLRRLLPEATFVGGRDLEVSGCSADAGKLKPGQVFVAIGDDESQGNTLVARALAQGATAVIVDRPHPEIPRQILVPSTRSAYSRLCHALAGDPSTRLDVVGVAGGREAQLVTLLIHAICNVQGERFGQVGPHGWSDGHAVRPMGAGLTDAGSLSNMLAGMLKRNCVGALVEVSQATLESTGIADGLSLGAAIVPCVREASDEDADALVERRRAYARLLRCVKPQGIVIVNQDDPDSEILGAVNLDARRISIGINKPADFVAEVEWYEANRSRFRLISEGVDAMITLRLGGIEAIQAALCAVAYAFHRGIALETIIKGLEAVEGIPGRFERVEEGQAFEVRIDAARSVEELTAAIEQTRAGIDGKLICVIGAEGYGDRNDRQALAKAAHDGADVVVFTSDNPRGEDVAQILDQMHGATDWAEHIRLDGDRRRAIETAIAIATPGDAVLIAGKGRNAFEILADRVIPFDDRAVAARFLRIIRTNEIKRDSA